MITWSFDDIRIVGDIVVGSLLASTLRLIVVKGLFEPAAVWAFKAGYRKVDALTGDRLPDLPAALGGKTDTPQP